LTTQASQKRRARRGIASDEAHAWARSLPLNNPNGKTVLRALALYVNGEGCCFVGLDQLSEDTDLSVDTVRRRLVWLEQVGAIVRLPQWLDQNGRRNGEGRGKRTTDDIRLLLDADLDEIERRTREDQIDKASNSSTETMAISPSREQGLNEAGESVSPQLAPRQPLHSCEGLISEPEPESSPQPPSGGECNSDSDQEGRAEPQHFAEFWVGYPGYRVMDRSRALAIFSVLTEPEQALARAAVPLLSEDLTKLKRRPKDAYKWLRDKGFDQYPHAKLPEKPADPVWIDEGPDIDALRVLALIGDRPPPALIHDDVKGSGLLRRCAVQDDLRALSTFAGSDILDWFVAEPDTREFNAWRHRIHEWTALWSEPRIVMRRGTRLMELKPGEPKVEVQNRLRGIPVPCRWPPRKDGTILPESNEGER
jgi:hypothetical protein